MDPVKRFVTMRANLVVCPDILSSVKVMVSIPDDLLARIDAGAAERGETRSGFLQEAARMRLGEPDPELLEALAEMQEIGRNVPADVPPARVLIRQDRDSR